MRSLKQQWHWKRWPAGRKTVNEIAGAAYKVHPHQVATWKREAQAGLKTGQSH